MSKKVLLVDDEIDILEFLTYNFLKQGYEVFTAKNGKEGMMKAKSFLPDAIVADIRMPELNGIEMCRQLRAEEQPRIKNIPVLFLTADDDEYLAMSSHQAGGTKYITKPTDIYTILELVQEMIEE